MTYNGTKSAITTLRCGVSQKSKLDPLLFLIYINELASICEHTMPNMYADDTNFSINGDDLLGILHILNTELESISHWLNVNELSLM